MTRHNDARQIQETIKTIVIADSKSAMTITHDEVKAKWEKKLADTVD